MNDKFSVAIIGGGLAGCELALQLAQRDVNVALLEMRPVRPTPAHKTGGLAELVCSNSMKSISPQNAHGLLKAELHGLGCLLLQLAKGASVPAGEALAVDPKDFSKLVEEKIASSPNIKLVREEVLDPETLHSAFDRVVIASGPLTSEGLMKNLSNLLGEGLYFYDAIAPVIQKDSIDFDIAYLASRYGKGEAAYINCPLNQEEYYVLMQELVNSDKVDFKDYEQAKHFEGCLPIEVMAARGRETLSFGPMKPVGLEQEGKVKPYAVVQLRQENTEATLFNLVGCQTRMKYSEQKRVFKLIPGLENAEFSRLGSMHRNSYINAPLHLNKRSALKIRPYIYVTGQIAGVEGYVESIASGLWVALQVMADLKGLEPIEVNRKTMLGGLMAHMSQGNSDNFQPMNSNFGLLEGLGLPKKIKKKEKKELQSQRAIEQNQLFAQELKAKGLL
ncbi:MAG: methylenetetrahydrofolate--tRNA-(uracil(54)-C(5))-methyltransferase (FADH(2)-oxidizing) TrmFO [SAR324 cluster bacterium]|nr:methylenetetrahydrofolate--tRNA-(uracil(54)-C(5))-methyltransferase (FADH(2)-oxidizing) TrmFO [SAR324 cluster bacterium]